MNSIRFATWNLNNRKITDKHAQLLESLRIDVLAAQECSRNFYSGIEEVSLFQHGSFSLDHRCPQPIEGRGRNLGCAIFSQYPIISEYIIDRVALPERALTCLIDLPTRQFLACSFHIPPGATWKRIKPETFIALAHWLNTVQGDVIVGMDANTPKRDAPKISDNEWWWKEEPSFLGANPLHQLRDSYRLYLEGNPQEQKRIIEKSPEGPLAVTHVRGRGKNRTPCRYDFILVNPTWEVISIDHLFEDSIRAGSDHGIVVAEIALPDS